MTVGFSDRRDPEHVIIGELISDPLTVTVHTLLQGEPDPNALHDIKDAVLVPVSRIDSWMWWTHLICAESLKVVKSKFSFKGQLNVRLYRLKKNVHWKIPEGEMSNTPVSADPPTWRVLSAFATVYLIWGSTYLAIRFAIETLPPFTMASFRFVVAGGILYAFARARSPRPTRRQWRSAAIVGILLLSGGNGAVVWAEQWVPSGRITVPNGSTCFRGLKVTRPRR